MAFFTMNGIGLTFFCFSLAGFFFCSMINGSGFLYFFGDNAGSAFTLWFFVWVLFYLYVLV